MKKIILIITLLVIPIQLFSRNDIIQDFDFNFDNEDLVTIIGNLAQQEDKNILFPQGANAIKQKVSIHLPGKISSEKAWEYIATFLNLSGYTMLPHNGITTIIKNDQNANRDTLPIYVGFNPQDFPHTSNKIRAIIYLTNLKVPEKNDANATDPINMILNDVLSAQKSVTFDTKTNSIIAADSADKLATALTIISLLDRSGDPNVVEVIKVFNVDANIIADLIKTQILALTGDAKGALKADVKSETGLYFGQGTLHLVADNRLNSIILTGAGPSIERMKNLIAELDQPVDSGRSILHVYELEYLDAETFAPILERLVKSGSETGQATKDLKGGTRKNFEGVIVVAEKKTEEKAESLESSAGEKSLLQGSAVFRGGNRLIVTATQQDWNKIKELIRSLDVPQPIVIVEVMVIDVTVNEDKILGAQLRNMPADIATTLASNGVTAQTNFLETPILNTVVNPGGAITQTPEPAKLASDLLSLINPASSSTLSPQNPFSVAQELSIGNPGSIIMSFNDKNNSGIWGVLQILDSYSDLRVLSHPFLVARNNKEAETIISTIRRDQGQAFAGQAAVVSQKIEDIEARLRVGIVPRVSSLDRINMQIAIDVQEFTSNTQTNFTRNTRTVNTNANISSGQVLALGGLSTLTEIESTRKLPILSDIPILGPFFQSSTRNMQRINLLILITPTIIEPKIRGGIEVYTKSKISKGFEIFETQSVIGNPRDPVTRWFFKTKLTDAEETTNVFLSQAQGDFVREFEQKHNHRRDNTRPNRSNRRRRNKANSATLKPHIPTREYQTEVRQGL